MVIIRIIIVRIEIVYIIIRLINEYDGGNKEMDSGQSDMDNSDIVEWGSDINNKVNK
jgi:hypothetical protein